MMLLPLDYALTSMSSLHPIHPKLIGSRLIKGEAVGLALFLVRIGTRMQTAMLEQKLQH